VFSSTVCIEGENLSYPAVGELKVFDGEYWVNQTLAHVFEWSDIAAKYAGTAFPGSPSNGQPFYRTDLDMPELFHYDSTRAKWLGELRVIFIGRASSTSSGNLDLTHAGVVGTSSQGILTPSQLCIVGVELFSGNATFSGTIDLYEGSTNLASILTVSASRSGSDHTLNQNIDADAGWPHKYFKVNVTGGTIDNPIINVYTRRVLT